MVDNESAACNSIANCNCSVYSYHSVVRFGSALHQKHWHRKHLCWVPDQRRVPKAPFSASIINTYMAHKRTALEKKHSTVKHTGLQLVANRQSIVI